MGSVAEIQADTALFDTAPLSRDEQKRLTAFIAVIVIVASPGKFLFYLSPGILILISVFGGNFIRIWRLVSIVFATIALSVATMAFDVEDGGHANIPGLIFGVLGYLPIFILWSLSKHFRVSEGFAWRLATVCSIFIFLEAAIGSVQWLLTRDGDYVSGTLGLFDALTREKTISQVNYCFTIFCMVIYCAIWIQKGRMKLACVVALAAVLMASTMHQTFFFMALLPALAITSGRQMRRLAIAVGITGIALAGTFFLDQRLIEDIDGWVDKVLAPSSPKSLAVTGALELMHEKNLVLGVGLGQFSSRAAILSSGNGSSVNLPKSLVDTSTNYDRFMQLPVFRYGQYGENSAMSMPYFSILSVITEFGPIVAIIILFKIVQTVIQNIRLGSKSQAAWRASCYCNFLIGFLFLCSWIQNYLELTQAVMIPILLYIVSKARLRALAEGIRVSGDASFKHPQLPS